MKNLMNIFITAVLILSVLVGFIIYLMRGNNSSSSTNSTSSSSSVFDSIKKFLAGWNQWWIMLLAGITTLVLAFVTMYSGQNDKDGEKVTRDKFIASIFLGLFTCITFYQALKLWSGTSKISHLHEPPTRPSIMFAIKNCPIVSYDSF